MPADGRCPQCGRATLKEGWWCRVCLHDKCVRAHAEAVAARDGVELSPAPAIVPDCHQRAGEPRTTDDVSGGRGSCRCGELVTRRRFGKHTARVTVWHAVTATAGELLGELSDDVERVYLCGGRPGANAAGARTWATAPLPDGWSHDEAGHYLDGVSPIFKYCRPDGGRVEVHRSASWLGEGAYTPAEAEAAMAAVGELIGRHFKGARMLATPATTGRELILRTLPLGDWPVLCDEHQELIRSTSGQGRIEVVGKSCQCGACVGFAANTLAGLAEYDGRLMYAALCWGLGRGPTEHDHGDEYEGQRRGRYRVTFTVPAGWRHVGILGAPLDGGRGWHYPNVPGWSGETWADGAELHVALRAGWHVQIHERLLLADLAPTPDPLGVWAKKLGQLRSAEDDPLVRAAVRALALTAIGALHGRGHRTSRVTPVAESRTVPVEAEVHLDGDQLVWFQGGEQKWAAMAHPEWSAAVWARARARLLSGPGDVGALHVEPADVVGFRTDAVYLARRYRWADDGAPGRLVAKGYRPGPIPAPQSSADLLRLRAKESTT